MGSYSILLEKENEVCFSLYSWIDHKSIHEIVFGVGYYYSIFKKPGRFDLKIPAELNLHYDWYKDKQTSEIYWHCGPFFSSGVIPAYNISKCISSSCELKVGIGYQWAKEFEYRLNNTTYRSSESGLYYVYIGRKT